MIYNNKRIGFNYYPESSPMGDLITFSSIPENFYKTHGTKLIDINKSWIFDHNPYVLRVKTEFDYILDYKKLTSDINNPISKIIFPPPYFKSHAEMYCNIFGINLFLRNPRLYRFEDIIPNNNFISIHTTPGNRNSIKDIIPDHVIEHICNFYKGHTIFQVGGIGDKKINCPNVIDRTGLSFWESAEIISKCGTFIGVDSGPMHLANCYQKVRKKIVLIADECLNLVIPNAQIAGNYGGWLDYNCEYFNTSDIDMGITNSFLKI